MNIIITGIESLDRGGYIYHLAQELEGENSFGTAFYGRCFSKTEFKGLFVGDIVKPHFANSSNGWYIKELKKGA